MLAEKFNPKKHTAFPYYSQPKLDGIRCLVSKDGMQSRNGKPIVSSPHILEALQPFFAEYPYTVLDGELYNHNLKNDFENLVSLIRKTKPTEEDLKESKEKVQYHIYDVLEDSQYQNRQEFLKKIENLHLSDCIEVVETHLIRNLDDLEWHLSEYIEDGYEGQMIRIPDSLYEGKRSQGLLKHKEFEDGEFKIVSVIEGKGNWARRAKAIEILLEDGTTQRSGVRGSLDKLKEIWHNKKQYIGTDVTVRFQNRTADGKLRFPVIVYFWKGKRDL